MSYFGEDFERALSAVLPRVPVPRLQIRLANVREIVRGLYNVENHHQDLGSMITLYLLAAWYRPEVIVEIGTSHGLSLSTWIIYAQAEIHAVDLTLQPFYRVQAMDPLPAHFLTLHEGCVSTMNFPAMIRERRVLFFYDIHDIEGRSFFREVAVPRIFPYLSRIPHLFVMHDISSIPEGTVLTDNRMVGPLPSFDGRWWTGFQEVTPLMEWTNQNRIPLFRPSELLEGVRTNPIGVTSLVALQVPKT